MNRTLSVFFLSIFLQQSAFAQSVDSSSLIKSKSNKLDSSSQISNLIYFEFNPLLFQEFSLDYEHIFFEHLSVKAGFGFWPIERDPPTLGWNLEPTISFGAYYMYQLKKIFFEIGLGGDFQTDPKLRDREYFFHNNSSILPNGRLGVFFKSENASIWGFAFSPAINFRPIAIRPILTITYGSLF